MIDELNFRIPGFEPLFCMNELAFYNDLFEKAIREANCRLEHGIIEVYQTKDVHHKSLGVMPVSDAIVKFGIVGRK